MARSSGRTAKIIVEQVAILGLAALGVRCGGVAPDGSISSNDPSENSGQALMTVATEGWYRIAPKLRSSASFDLPNYNGTDGSLSLYDFDGGTDQKVFLKNVGNGQWEMIPRSNMGVRFELPNADTTNGNQLRTWGSNSSAAQRWYLTRRGDGYWKVTSAVNGGKVIDLAGCNTNNGTKIQLWDDYNNDCQAWDFIQDGNVAVAATVYQDCNYGGYAKPLLAGDYSFGDMLNMGINNDDISSFHVYGSNRMVLFWDASFSSDSATFYGDNGCLVDQGWNDKASAFKVQGYGGYGAAGLAVDYVKHSWWNGSGWTDDWYDGFDGGSLNRNNWTPVVSSRDGTCVNNEQQCYVDEEGYNNNFWVGDGRLNILVQKEDRGCCGRTMNYSSARLTTKAHFHPQNGAWEARLQLFKTSNANGIWPAFWLLGNNVNESPNAGSSCWPTWSAREHDIWEYAPASMGWNQFITNSIAGNGCQAPYTNNGYAQTPFSGYNPYANNTYRLEYWGGQVKFFSNGAFIRALPDGDWANQDFAAIINMAMGGTLGGGSFGW